MQKRADWHVARTDRPGRSYRSFGRYRGWNRGWRGDLGQSIDRTSVERRNCEKSARSGNLSPTSGGKNHDRDSESSTMESPWWDGMTEPRRHRPEDVHEFCCAILEKLKVPAEDAKEVAACLLQADLRGVDSHGMIRLPIYAERVRMGVVNPRPVAQVVRSNIATALLDGDNGLGPVVGSKAMEKAIELAQNAGIGFVGVRRSNHFGIAAFYVQKAVR